MNAKNQEINSRCCFGIIILIVGISITVAIPTFGYFSPFLIIIGVIVILVEICSETGDASKNKYPTVSRMQRSENCPICRRKLFVNSSGDKHCYYCGYQFLKESSKVPNISDEKKEEPKITSDIELFPPISVPIKSKETSKSIPTMSELKPEEIDTVPSGSEKKIEKSFINCPHCRQKLPLGVKFCARCGQKIDLLKPIPLVSSTDEGLVKEIPDEELKPTPLILDIKETDGKADLNWLKHQYYNLGRTMQDIADELGVSMIRIRKMFSRIKANSEKLEAKSIRDVPPSKIEELRPTPSVLEKIEQLPKEVPAGDLQLIPSISKMKEEKVEIIPVHEIRPTPSVIEKKVEKPKKEYLFCKFCGMRIPKNITFCIQCGTIIKSNIT